MHFMNQRSLTEGKKLCIVKAACLILSRKFSTDI